MNRVWLGACLALSLLCCNLSQAQSSAPSPAPAVTTASGADSAKQVFRIAPADDGWRVNLPRAAEPATQAYLARLPADVVARANDYFEGGYWLQLWNFLLGLAVSALLLHGKRSAALRDWAQRVGRRRWLGDGLYGAAFSAIGFVLSLPLTIYQGFVREHSYAMATQSFMAWSVEQLIGLAVSMVVSAIAVATLYVVLRRAGERWWLWGTVATTTLLALMLLVSPIWIEPLFNTYKPLADGPIKSSILAMARANGVPVDNVYEFDASRQTTRVSANVSGLFGTAAVRLNDNLLRRASLPEIRAVMGHEMGHYVMNHVPKMLLQFGVFMLAGFLFAQWAMSRLLARHGQRWGLGDHTDVASLPLLVAVISVFMFLGTPVQNTIIRTQELEADRFGLNLAREPHGAAEAYLKLTEYRKPNPGPIEEFVFFDHPSTRTRIFETMRWREAMGTP